MEKTFEELLKPHQKRFDYHNSQRIYIDKADVLQLIQQVREATGNEFLKAMEGVDLPMVTTMKIMAIMATSDRIKLTE